MADPTAILSFSYPEELKEELQSLADDEGYKLATYIKMVLSVFLQEGENGKIEPVKTKNKKKKKRRKK